MITPVIMAGGSGSRLWPLSRSLYPKQFLALTGEQTMLQETLQRLSNLDVNAPLVICNEEHRFIVAEQLRALDKTGSIILEPVGRNTAPAIALAAEVTVNDNDPLLLVLAADHVIQNTDAFTEAVKSAIPLAQAGKLVTFGIVPTQAHTSYGYIKRGNNVSDSSGYNVNAFVEKPDPQTAANYVESGEYYWNSGMFLIKASRYLQELQKYRPEIFNARKKALEHTTRDNDFVRLDAQAFAACPDESVDYAVMENTTDAVVVSLDAGWNDIGAWSALWEVNEKDEVGNTAFGDTILQETSNSLIHGGERLIATVGLDNIVIVDTKDALLVACKDKVQDVKKIAEKLKVEKRSEFKVHREVY
jgi:mannose-1-phosphate guanylyltransferase